MNVITRDRPLAPEQLEAALRQIGAERYHNLHPFHRALHRGKLTRGQVQAWALNRYYYQSTIPLKDAVVISRFRDRGIRMEWRHRIEDHDGDVGTEGGIERWLKLTEGLGLDSPYVESAERILPATRSMRGSVARCILPDLLSNMAGSVSAAPMFPQSRRSNSTSMPMCALKPSGGFSNFAVVQGSASRPPSHRPRPKIRFT